MKARFGTDGLRGRAGDLITPELAQRLGRSAARILGAPADRIYLGRDTRWSGTMLAAAFASGAAAEGIDVVDLGVVPTPVVASMAAAAGCPGAVVSASHNPYPDNGIKLFAAGGTKLRDDQEAAIEADMESGGATYRSGDRLGRVVAGPDALARYQDKLTDALQGRSMSGIKVVLDTANGAAVATAREAFERAGAKVVDVVGALPDGTNINSACGSSDPSALASSVTRAGADLGLAFDGDADRVVAVDDDGRVVDGDRLLALFATDLKERGQLRGGGIAVTVMSNLGLHKAMAYAGIDVVTTQVGDRNILEALESRGWSLGGEQSGHIIFPDLATTGDGVLTGLLLVDLVVRSGRTLAELGESCMRSYPQVTLNVPVVRRDELEGAAVIWSEVALVEEDLGDSGRVLLRASGTEQLVRVMVEAADEAEASAAADRLAGAVARILSDR